MLNLGKRASLRLKLSQPEATGDGKTPSTTFLPLAFVCLVSVLGIGWRLVDLTEWPFPFHPTVQYESALAARSLWLSVSPDARTFDRVAWLQEAGYHHIVSPPLLPVAVAGCYLVAGEEIPWISKVFTALLWVGAGWFVFGAVVRQTGSHWAGAIVCAWFNFTPYGLMLSRSFQTDSVAIFGFSVAIWHLSRPGRHLTWRETLVSAAICGLAGVVKPGILLPAIVAGFAASLLARSVSGPLLLKAAHVAAFAAVVAGPSVGYVKLWMPERGAELKASLLSQPAFYEAVATMVGHVVGYWSLVLGVAGILLAAWRRSYLGVGLVAGYLAYVGIFTYHCSTHAYYHAPLLVIVAYGLGSLIESLTSQRWRLPQPVLAAVAVVALGIYIYASRLPYVGPWRGNALVQRVQSENVAKTQKRAEAYRAVREMIRPATRVIALAEDYGAPFEYATGLYVAAWPAVADSSAPSHLSFSPEQRLGHFIAAGFTFFVVTDFAELESQPDLRAVLKRYGRVVFAAPDVHVYELPPGPSGPRSTAEGTKP